MNSLPFIYSKLLLDWKVYNTPQSRQTLLNPKWWWMSVRWEADITLLFSFKMPSQRHKKLSNETIMSFFNMLNLLYTKLTVWTSWNNDSAADVSMCPWVYVCTWVEVGLLAHGQSRSYNENRTFCRNIHKHIARFTCVRACVRTHKHTHMHIIGYTHITIPSSTNEETTQS